jgi:hypothetical protein
MNVMSALRLIAVRTNAVDIFYRNATAKLVRRISQVPRSEEGVVTVEWVAVAAAVTLGAISIAFIIMNGLVNPARNIASQLSP